MYQLTKESFEIKQTVTPWTLKELKDLGLYNSGLTADKEIETILDLFIDVEKFKRLVNAIFVIDKEIEYDEVSLQEFLKGYQDFFGLLLKSFIKPTT